MGLQSIHVSKLGPCMLSNTWLTLNTVFKTPKGAKVLINVLMVWKFWTETLMKTFVSTLLIQTFSDIFSSLKIVVCCFKSQIYTRTESIRINALNDAKAVKEYVQIAGIFIHWDWVTYIKQQPVLIQIMAWHRIGDKSLSEPMLVVVN